MTRSRSAILCVATLACVLIADISFAQESTIDAKAWYLLAENELIRRELEITPEQFEAIKRQTEVLNRWAAPVSDGTAVSDFFHFQRLKALDAPNEVEQRQLAEFSQRQLGNQAAFDAEAHAAAAAILLPFQIKRLNQLTLWEVVETNGYGAFLGWYPIRTRLDLGPSQSDKIRETTKRLTEEFNRDLEDLRARYRDRLNQVLDPAQKKEIEAILGERPKMFERANSARF
jgi:hypothetical protein